MKDRWGVEDAAFDIAREAEGRCVIRAQVVHFNGNTLLSLVSFYRISKRQDLLQPRCHRHLSHLCRRCSCLGSSRFQLS